MRRLHEEQKLYCFKGKKIDLTTSGPRKYTFNVGKHALAKLTSGLDWNCFIFALGDDFCCLTTSGHSWVSFHLTDRKNMRADHWARHADMQMYSIFVFLCPAYKKRLWPHPVTQWSISVSTSTPRCSMSISTFDKTIPGCAVEFWIFCCGRLH